MTDSGIIVLCVLRLIRQPIRLCERTGACVLDCFLASFEVEPGLSSYALAKPAHVARS